MLFVSRSVVFPLATLANGQQETLSLVSCAPYPLLIAGRESPVGWRWASLARASISVGVWSLGIYNLLRTALVPVG